MSNDEINLLADEYENDIKQIKDIAYRFSWYMRGGVSYEQLMYDTDVADNEIMQKIIKENIENTKNSKLPLI